MKTIEKRRADMLYNIIREFLLNQNNNTNYNYQLKYHQLYENDATPEVKARFYNESGLVELENETGQIIVVEICRVHPHQHNGWSGLNGVPRLYASIYEKGNEDNPLWKLEVSSGTFHYEAKTTDIELPSIIGTDLVFKKIKLKVIPLEKYFKLSDMEQSTYLYDYNEIKKYIYQNVSNKNFYIEFNDDEMIIMASESTHKKVLESLRNYYENNQYHITRMFGSYVLIKGNKEKLVAVKATPIPIKYCPLMKNLLNEISGDIAMEILKTLEIENEEKQTEMMCNLINEVVIKGGYFDTNRPLNSCEANVLFGASETMASAFTNNLIDAAVIVSNNLGTIITTNNSNTQGAVKRMTGLFFTSPSEKIMQTAYESGIIPVFPYTAEINQIAGVKKAIEMGYKNIAVSVAANDNYLHEKLSQIERDNNIRIFKFGLCSTGIDEKTSIVMRENADVIWTCASKQVKEYVEPYAIAQVGIKIPVHIMSENGWEIVSHHLSLMNTDINYADVELATGDEKPVFINDKGTIKLVLKKNVHANNDCPRPCI